MNENKITSIIEIDNDLIYCKIENVNFQNNIFNFENINILLDFIHEAKNYVVLKLKNDIQKNIIFNSLIKN